MADAKQSGSVDDESSKKPARTLSSKGKGPAAKEKKSSDAVAKTDDNTQELILSFMKNIQTSLKKQSDKLTDVCTKVQTMEESCYNYETELDYEEYEEIEGDESNTPTAGTDSATSSSTSSQKRSLDESSRFAQMTKKFRSQEICAEDIDSALAENVTEFFVNGIDEDRYTELVKDEVTPRPANIKAKCKDTMMTSRIWDNVEKRAIQTATLALLEYCVLHSYSRRCRQVIENYRKSRMPVHVTRM